MLLVWSGEKQLQFHPARNWGFPIERAFMTFTKTLKSELFGGSVKGIKECVRNEWMNEEQLQCGLLGGTWKH